jgi:uncharacterized protein (TIGR03435 family)
VFIGSRLRLGIALGAAVVIGPIAVVWTVLNIQPRSTGPWLDFSIGPTVGTSTSISVGTIRSEGISTKALVGLAWDIPPVRVLGPDWLARTRYSVKAVVDIQDAAEWRGMLRQELERRFHLEAHTEPRPFDVYVLSAPGEPQIERADGRKSNTWFKVSEVQLKEVSMAGLATALQHIIGQPVVDETGIDGRFNLELAWEQDRVTSVTRRLAAMGLQLTPAKRDLEALVVDRAERDAALLLIERLGGLARMAPRPLREPIGWIFSVR